MFPSVREIASSAISTDEERRADIVRNALTKCHMLLKQIIALHAEEGEGQQRQVHLESYVSTAIGKNTTMGISIVLKAEGNAVNVVRSRTTLPTRVRFVKPAIIKTRS